MEYEPKVPIVCMSVLYVCNECTQACNRLMKMNQVGRERKREIGVDATH